MNKMKEDFGFWKNFNSTMSNLSHSKRLTSDSECLLLPTTTTTRFFSDSTINKQQLQKRIQFKLAPLEIDKIGDELLLTTKKTISRNLSNRKSGFGTNVTHREFVEKFQIYVEKSLKLLHEIRSFLSKGVIEPNGVDDYQRRLKRVQEFSTRFSRYYLYQLNQLTNELTFTKKLIPTTINYKLLNCHQIIVQSLQAYLRHLPTSIGDCACDKFKLLLNEIVYVCQLYGVLKKIKIDENTDIYIDTLKKSVVSVTEEIGKFQAKLNEMKKTKIIRKKSVKHVGIKIDPNRFSMYGRTTPETLTEKKFKKVKSRYRTATFKHRPPIEKQPSSVLPLPKRKFPIQRYTNGALKNLPIPTPTVENEIEVETMVQHDNERALTLYHEDVINSNNFDDNEETPLDIFENTRKTSVVTVTEVDTPKRICIRDDNFMFDDNLKIKQYVSSETQTDINWEKEAMNMSTIMEILKICEASKC